jgi:hypothetical protein
MARVPKKRHKHHKKNVMPAKYEGTPPDIIYKLVDPFWKKRLGMICGSFKSRNPHDMTEVWLGNLDLQTVSDLLDCTG